jgi:hypothetical protein
MSYLSVSLNCMVTVWVISTGRPANLPGRHLGESDTIRKASSSQPQPMPFNTFPFLKAFDICYIEKPNINLGYTSRCFLINRL